MAVIGAGLSVSNRKAYHYIAEEFPEIPQVVIVDENDAAALIAMQTDAAPAWLTKSASAELITDTIQAVNEGSYRQQAFGFRRFFQRGFLPFSII